MSKKRLQRVLTQATYSKARIYLLPILLFVAIQVYASPLFDGDSVLDVTLTGPLQALIDAKTNGKEWPFVLEADDNEHRVKVRSRGKSRLQLCRFPLLRLSFRDDDTFNSVFAGQDNLKLVTHCRKNASSRVDTLQEYAAYRIFNIISDFSYDTRLLRVSYSDPEDRLKGGTFSRYAFLVESESEFEQRTNAQRLQLEGVAVGSLSQPQAALVYVFHYLIGNTDWSLVTAEGATACCHNGHLYKFKEEIYLVPNDFDLSGLVNARYAKPRREVGISRVTQRRYRGYCTSTNALNNALTQIRAKQAEILAVFDELPGLTATEIKSSKKFLRRFFDRAGDQAKMVKSFESRCLR